MRVMHLVVSSLLALTLVGCGDESSEGGAGGSEAAAPATERDKPKKPKPGVTLPKKDLTAGGTFPEATKDVVCAEGYADEARQRDRVKAAEVFTHYGLDPAKASADRKAHQVDRLIPTGLGGSNALDNSWPQPKAEVKAKNALETKVRREVCSGALPLEEAQRLFADDWVAAQERFAS